MMRLRIALLPLIWQRFPKRHESLVKEACTKRLINSAHLQTRNVFPLPQVAATRIPQLDSFIKPEVPQLVKMSDKEWARLQTFALDALAPLTSLLEADAKGETFSRPGAGGRKGSHPTYWKRQCTDQPHMKI